MQVQSPSLKSKAINLRQQGSSIREIEIRLRIARSTLSYWFRDIELSTQQHEQLLKKWKSALVSAREKAAVWHSEQKKKRILLAENQARETMARLDSNSHTLELALAILYLGEGGKSPKGLVLGNSNVDILKFFVATLKTLYKVGGEKLRCELHLRADQNPKKEIGYWSKELKIPKKRFQRSYLDKRTSGKKTFPSYHGVCVVAYDNLAIQRKLMYLYQLYCQKIIQQTLGG